MTHYLIEYRLFGSLKKDINQLIRQVNNKFFLRSKKRIIPHMSIVAPFYTNNQKRLTDDFKETCKTNKIINLQIKGFDCFNNANVIYVKVNQSEELMNFRNNLIDKIKQYSKLNKTDALSFLGFKFIKKYKPHITIAMKLNNEKFKAIKDFVKNKKFVSKNYKMERVTLIKNRKILLEYDFVLKKMLNRRKAKSKRLYSKTMRKLLTEKHS